MSNTVITYSTAKSDFMALLDLIQCKELPTGLQYALESAYRTAEHGSKFADLSFFLLENNTPEACVLYHKYNENASGFNGTGAQITFFQQNKKNTKAVIDALCALALSEKLDFIIIADEGIYGPLSLIGEECLNRQGAAKYKLRVAMDLIQSEDNIYASIRRRYKPFINKGRREMNFIAVTQETIEKSAFDDFQNFHFTVAGKKTRPQESWDIQFQMIQAGQAELLMGYMESYGLVSAALFTDMGKTTSYAVAVYNRDLFDHPLAHANVYEGLVRAKQRGQSLFNLGVIPMYGEATQKELNIAKFKRGFGTTNGFIEWIIPLNIRKEDGSESI